MKKALISKTTKFATLLALTAALTSWAQTDAIWIGPASGGEWNTGAYWDTGLAPADPTTNAFIGTGTNVSYNLPMVASSFGTLTLNGILNVNTNGFANSAITMIRPGGGNVLNINSGGDVNVTGNLAICSNAVTVLNAGGTLNVQGELLVGSGTNAPTYVSGGSPGGSGSMTNFGGTINATNTAVNRANSSANSRLIILGGTNNLGNVVVRRASGNPPPALGTEGFVVNDGLVNMTSLDIGGVNGNSWQTMYMTGGTVTNTGAFTVRSTSTASRGSRFLQAGGLFVSTDAGGVHLRGASANVLVMYGISGGTNLVEGFVVSDAGDTLGTVGLTNSAKIYVGAGGMSMGGGTLSATNVVLDSGGIFGAQADWTGSVPMILAGGTIDAAALDGTPHNITLNGGLRGTGSLNKTGGGTLAVSEANTYSGSTVIRNGTLALGATGTLASTPIIVSSGATFDVSAVSGYTLDSGKTLQGMGTVVGAAAVASGATVNPGSNVLNGTLTFSGSLTETGDAINHFDLSSNPSGPDNDLIVVGADLNVSGVNTIEVSGGGPEGSVHPLIQYGGAFNGGITNFTVTGATGSLSNSASAKTLYLVISITVRSPTNVTWVGNAAVNDWDTLNATNWSNHGVLDYFVSGDDVRFDNTGAANPLVNIVGGVFPGSVTVDSTSDYTFTGEGQIGGLGGLTKSNTGTLTVQTTNSYTGVTAIRGGVVAVAEVANAALNSPLGAASADPANLVLGNGTLRYTGASASTDRGVTLDSSGAQIAIATDTTTLTLNGPVVGLGSLTKSGAGTLTLPLATSFAGTTTVSNGTLRVNVPGAASTNTIVLAGGTLHIALPTDNDLLNPIHVATASVLRLGTLNNRVNGAVTGSSTLNVDISTGGSVLTFNGNLTNFNGVFNLGTSVGTFRFNSGGGNTTFGCPNATIDLGTGSATLMARNAGTMNVGALLGGPSTIVNGQGSGSGTIVWEIGSSTNLPSSTFDGTIQDATTSRLVALTKIGPGTLTLRGNNTYTGATRVSNGVLALSDNGAITASTNINVAAGASLDVSSRVDGTLYLNYGQTLQGNGTVRGMVSTVMGGTVAPGDSIGTLTVTNTVTLGGTAWMEIDRSGVPNADKLVSPSIVLGGTLVVTNIGARLQPGDTFDLFDGSLSGSFYGSVVLPSYYTWNTSNLEVNGTISVVSALPGPSFTSIARYDANYMVLNAVNGLPYGSLAVLTSTNLALPLNQWTLVNTTFFDGTGNLVDWYVPTDPAASQQFFLIQAY